MTINLYTHAGEFAENKDVARDIRVQHLLPALESGEQVVLDFDQITGATQSFIHALISEPFRLYGSEMLDVILFKNCNDTVQKIIRIVVEYMQAAS